MPTTTYVSTVSQLEDAFAKAEDGDTIALAAGTYGAARLTGRDFAKAVTITSADPDARAVLTDDLVINKVTNLTVTGIDLDAAKLSSFNDNRVSITNSESITLHDMLIEGRMPTAREGVDPDAPGVRRGDVIAGYGLETGLQVRNVKDVRIEDVEMRDLRKAVTLLDGEDVLLTGVEVHRVREGINLTDMVRLEIVDNHFHDFRPWNPSASGDHPDMIQYWGINGTVGIHDLVIRDNLFDQPGDQQFTQTILGRMDRAPEGITATNWIISGNVIGNSHLNAMRLSDIHGLEITDNVILPNSAEIDRVQIPAIILDRSTDVLIDGNTVMDRDYNGIFNVPRAELQANKIVIGDNRFLDFDPQSRDYWIPVAEEMLPSFSAPSTPPRETPDALTPDDIPANDPGTIVEGTDGRDKLTLRDKDGYLFGYDGNDKLISSDASTYMVGGSGADQFVFDYRSPDGSPHRDIIGDFDFAEGDVLRPLGSTRGTFSDAADPGNRLLVLSDGASAKISSFADLREAEMSGGLSYADSVRGDSLILTFAEAPGFLVEILNMTVDDVIA